MEAQGNSGDKFWLYVVPVLAQQGRASFAEAAQKILLKPWMLYGAIGLVTLLPVIVCWTSPGGTAWGKLKRKCTIPGPWGLPVIGSLLEMGTQAHRRLAALAKRHNAESLMAISLGKTRVIIASKPEVAREILNSSCFADRPLKQSAQELLFGRAIGFAPQGEYWRGLRRIASNHLFTPKRISAHEPIRQHETSIMIRDIVEDAAAANGGVLQIRRYLQRASLNNIMWSVFGRGYDFHGSDCFEAEQLQSMVREGFDLLGAFNWADHLTLLRAFDSHHIHERCRKLVPRVNAFVQKIIDEHRLKSFPVRSETDFVDVLLSLQGEEKLADADMVAVLWEMIFRGTDTTAILTEWILAELILHPEVQAKIHAELDLVVGSAEIVQAADVQKLTYLQAVIKETLRLHPPGPLLSWARLSTEDAFVAGHHVPKGTTAMVNMWSITHDPAIWSEPEAFKPGRFLASEGGADVDVKGNDLRLAPFGSGRRVCPGRVLGLATVQLWVARLVHQFVWHPSPEHPVVLKEVLKLSCEMETPLTARPVPRRVRSG